MIASSVLENVQQFFKNRLGQKFPEVCVAVPWSAAVDL